MAQAPDLDYILSDCFLAVGQAVGPDKGVEFRRRDVVAPTVSARLPPRDDHPRETSWAADRSRVIAVGRYLGQRVVEYTRVVEPPSTVAAAVLALGRGRAWLPDERDVKLALPADCTNSPMTAFSS